MVKPALALNPSLDVEALAGRFARDGRVQIRDFLDPSAAAALHATLKVRGDWAQVVNSGDRVFELSRAARADMTDEQRRALDEAVYAGARGGFQYRYETIRTPDAAAARTASADPLAAFAAWMSGGPTRDLLRRVVAEPGVAYADAQATAYAPGDFLTTHDDGVAGKNRHAAYVLSLTPEWRVEWGGLLLFAPAPDGTVTGLAPAFNTLNLFRVPQSHSVSEVSRAAPNRRYSITGWLRSGAQPEGAAEGHEL